MIGKQYPRKVDENGNYYYDTTAEPLKGSEEYNGQDLVFVNYIKSMTEGEENSGARSIKYEIQPGTTGDMNNDWVMFRYSEVIYNKAEALMRKNGGNQQRSSTFFQGRGLGESEIYDRYSDHG